MGDRRLGDLGQVLRFLVAGGTGFGLYLVFAMLLRQATELPAGVIAWLAMLCAFLPTFFIQRIFAFRASGRLAPQITGYALLQLASSVVVAAAAHVGGVAGLYDFASFVVAGFAGVAFSYLIQTKMIFPA